MYEWKKITTKFTSQCVQCNEYINKGESCLWLEKLGIKHEECPTGFIEDDSALVILDNEEKEKMGLL